MRAASRSRDPCPCAGGSHNPTVSPAAISAFSLDFPVFTPPAHSLQSVCSGRTWARALPVVTFPNLCSEQLQSRVAAPSCCVGLPAPGFASAVHLAGSLQAPVKPPTSPGTALECVFGIFRNPCAYLGLRVFAILGPDVSLLVTKPGCLLKKEMWMGRRCGELPNHQRNGLVNE